MRFFRISPQVFSTFKLHSYKETIFFLNKISRNFDLESKTYEKFVVFSPRIKIFFSQNIRFFHFVAILSCFFFQLSKIHFFPEFFQFFFVFLRTGLKWWVRPRSKRTIVFMTCGNATRWHAASSLSWNSLHEKHFGIVFWVEPKKRKNKKKKTKKAFERLGWGFGVFLVPKSRQTRKIIHFRRLNNFENFLNGRKSGKVYFGSIFSIFLTRLGRTGLRKFIFFF